PAPEDGGASFALGATSEHFAPRPNRRPSRHFAHVSALLHHPTARRPLNLHVSSLNRRGTGPHGPSTKPHAVPWRPWAWRYAAEKTTHSPWATLWTMRSSVRTISPSTTCSASTPSCEISSANALWGSKATVKSSSPSWSGELRGIRRRRPARS